MTKVISYNLHNQLKMQRLYQEAVARQGKCKYCGEQFQKLNELLEHEKEHEDAEISKK